MAHFTALKQRLVTEMGEFILTFEGVPSLFRVAAVDDATNSNTYNLTMILAMNHPNALFFLVAIEQWASTSLLAQLVAWMVAPKSCQNADKK